MVNDKVSDYSSSEFVTIEDQNDAEEQSLTSVTFAITSISLLVVSVLIPFWRDDDV
jgi:multidrug efflux pump subunit AcrB